MKLSAFDRLYSARVATGTTTLGFSTGSNSASGDIAGGNDVIGTPGDYTVVALRDIVSLASNMGDNTVGSVLTTIQSSPWLATFAMPSNSGSSSLSSNIALGSVTAGGSPVTVLDDASWNEFPGLCRLDANRVLLVFRRGTAHLTGGDIYGKIGVLAADKASVASWGSSYLIYSHSTEDVRLEDSVAVVDNKVVIWARLYDGSVNHAPFLLISDVAPSVLVESSTWTQVNVSLTAYSSQNYSQGHILKLQDGTYLLPYGGQNSAANHEVGVLKSSSLTDWSGMTRVVVGPVGANDYAEIAVEEMPGGELRAHFRENATNNNFYKSYSGNRGSNWSTPSLLFAAAGYPMWRRLWSGQQLTVYRTPTNGDNAWRSATDTSDLTWGSATTLDTTGTRSAYATLLQLTDTKILCVYAVEYSADGSTGTADLFSQVFTDASTFPSNYYSMVDENDLNADFLGNKLSAGSNVTFTVLQPYGREVLQISATAGTPSVGSNSTRVREISTIGASTTLFSPFDHAHDGIGTITASSSNTMQRGTFNLRSGNNISFGLTDGDGDGELDTMTIHGAAGGGGGGGGITAVALDRVSGDGAGNTSTNSTSFVDLSGASITISTGARRVKLGFSGAALNDNATGIMSFTFRVDSTDIGGTLGIVRNQNHGATSRPINASMTYLTDVLSAGSHTFKVRFASSAGNTSVLNTSAGAIWQFWAEESPT